MKIFLLFALVAAASAAEVGSKRPSEPWYKSGVKTNIYNCTGHEDGNYPHPKLCTHYIACDAQTHAYEMSCAMNNDGNLLHYVQDSGPDTNTSHCDRPEVAGCAGPTPPPEPPVITTEAPESGRQCEELDCWNEGWCRGYTVCDNGNSHSGQCEDDLWWNPSDLVAGYLTGQCDSWDNLSEEVQHNYTHTESCIPPCDWWPKDNAACTQEYVFREPFVNTIVGREHELTCSKGLVWAQEVHNCVHCSSKRGEDDHDCCQAGARR